ncbi:MAG: YqeG family HAD IIIA-type phosphatase [Clostridia bacterium]|nr:YqeG family HAD IIIA-type phosphatase [Clostridia bacterium]
MSSWLLPDYIFATYREVTPEFLTSIGIKALLIDIDNTLAPYEQPLPDEHIKAWFAALRQSGIQATFISNNGRERVEIFNEEIGLPFYCNSAKPFAKNLKRAMRDMGTDRTNTAMLGDQLLTDAAAGKHIGLKTIIVPPINDKNNAFFRTKRALEVGHIKKYVKLHGEDARAVCSFWLEKKYKKKNRE